MPRFEIIVVGPPDFISEQVRTAWLALGAVLVGPIACHDLHDEMARRAGGVLMDVSLDAAELFDISERLMMFDVPFLFVMNSRLPTGASQPYLLTEKENDIRAIISALIVESAGEERDRALH
ncbi:hypothetical protein ACFSE1_01035 [Rhizobium helianthi]|uniref:Response regulator n=1 Tax=Rhizobium helianthi TaxID=1132695 RepID=A0ABW4LYC6_9HYPH